MKGLKRVLLLLLLRNTSSNNNAQLLDKRSATHNMRSSATTTTTTMTARSIRSAMLLAAVMTTSISFLSQDSQAFSSPSTATTRRAATGETKKNGRRNRRQRQLSFLSLSTRVLSDEMPTALDYSTAATTSSTTSTTKPYDDDNDDSFFRYNNYNINNDASLALTTEKDNSSIQQLSPDFSSLSSTYMDFAKNFPLINNMMIASVKAASADVLAQTVFGGAGLFGNEYDWQRTILFCLFGAFYRGGFQYLYQVNIFSKIFPNVETFTNQSIDEKLSNVQGLINLAKQTIVDLTIMSLIYLPTYYTFKESIFCDSMDPSLWLSNGLTSYSAHFSKDEIDLLRVWIPADMVCFSVPLILRLPIRQVISLFYTTYLSYVSLACT